MSDQVRWEVARIPYTPRVWQAEVHRLRRQRPAHYVGDWTGIIPVHAVVVHRRGGKTTLAEMELIDSAAEDQRPDAVYGFFAPQAKQAVDTIWDPLKRATASIPGIRVRESDHYVQFPHGPRVELVGLDEPRTRRGRKFAGAVMDEYALMHPDAWESVIQIALADSKGWALFISTVGGVDAFSEMYFRCKGDQSGRMLASSYDVYQTGVFTAQEIAILKESMSEQAFRREFLNDFTAAGDDQLIALEAINAAMSRTIQEQAWSWAPRILGVDVAFSPTGDRSVITRRQGLMTWRQEVFRGLDNQALASHVARHNAEWRPAAIFVDRGRGEGVISRLQGGLNLPNVIPVDFGGAPLSPRFRNRKAELFHAVADYIASGACLPESPDLRLDLSGLRKKLSQVNGKIEVVYQDNLPSPDMAASLALTLAGDVVAPPEQVVSREMAAALGLVDPAGRRSGAEAIHGWQRENDRAPSGVGRAR